MFNLLFNDVKERTMGPKQKKFSLKTFVDNGLKPLTRVLAEGGATPNWITVIGVLVSFMVPYELLQDHWIESGCWLFASGFFDVLDGSLARNEKLQAPFGAFWDSTLDRLAEAVVFSGFVLYYGRHLDETGIILSLAVFTLSLIVSYTRARAEGMGVDCEVGVLPRPGRILLLIGGLLVHQLALVLLVVGFLSLITVGQRVHRVWITLQKKKKPISHR